MPKMRFLPAIAKMAIAAFLLSFSTYTVRAGDAASVEILGFSADGGIFAFEEYGVQDGSGFPYANRFYIRTATDSFVPGTPIRVRVEDESLTIDAVRAKARERGQSVIADAVLAANRGFVAGTNAVTELSADPFRLAVNPRPVFPPVDDPLEFRLEEIHVGVPDRCKDLGDVVGLRLTKVATVPGTEAEMIHEDSGIPQSRGCPIGYSLAGIQTFYPEAGEPVFALLIAVRTYGFEGPDHRFIAVTGPIDN
jgi:predicted secreted protein